MNTNRDRLDEAIDHVVTRMVRVEENDVLATQIVNALPERASWFGWLFHSWAPRLAMIAVVVAAGIVWGNRKPAPTPQPNPLASTMSAIGPVALVAAVREAEPNRTMPLEPVEPLEPLEPSSMDFDRSLPAIAPVVSLNFDSLAPDALPASEGLVLESLVIADLPLTAEPISPR
jgi:hypothetical protein